MEIKKNIGRRMQRLRLANGYTQEQLAEMVEASTTTISRMEIGKRMVGVEKLMQIAEALGVTVDALLYDSEEKLSETDEWDERIICLLEKCTADEKKYIWKMAEGVLNLHRNR